MVEPITIGIAIGYLVKSAPGWFHDLEVMLLSEGKELAVSQGKQHFLALLDKKKHLRHVELALKNAAERGLKEFDTPPERDLYRNILQFLTESDSSALRSEAMRLFTLSDNPDLTVFMEKYNLRQRIHALAHNELYEDIDITPYLNSFFNALITELYNDPLFRENMSGVLKMRTAFKGQRSLEEIVAILTDISKNLTKGYTLQEFSQEVNTYIEYIESAFRYHEFVGIALKGDEDAAPEIDSIFVPLRIALKQSMYSLNITYYDLVSVFEQIPYLVLLGGPGTGKSTITRYLAWSHAAANKVNDSTPPSIKNMQLLSGKPVPLRIELRRFSDVRRQHPGCSFLTYATDILLAQENISIHPQMFQELLERRAMLLLFDGLDEVPTLAERRQLISEIERFASRYPGNRLIVTSRPVGYDTASFSNRWFSHFEIIEFDDEQIHEFLESWYTYVLKYTSLSSDIRRELEAFYNTLKENVRLHKLATNPLLLTVMTAIHRYERLPDKRVQVYERCADLLLDKWAKLKGVDVRWKDLKMGKEDQSACIAHLGFVLHELSQREEDENSSIDRDILLYGENTDVSADVMRREIVRYIKNQNLLPSGAEQNTEAERFLDLVKIEAGLIVERGTDENGEALYGFVHRTFQEYFAATHIYGRYQDEGTTVISEFLQKHLYDPHWHEVILLLLGKLRRKPATIQLQQILEGNSRISTYTNVVQQDLFFICESLAEDINVENDFAEHIVTLVCNLIKKSPYPSQRKQAIKALGAFLRTRQYADLGWQKLQTLLAEESILDIPTIIDAIELLLKSIVEAEEQLQAIQLFLDLQYHPKISIQQMIQIAEALYRWSLPGSEGKRQSGRWLVAYAQRAELTIEHVIGIARTLCRYDSSGTQERQSIQQLISYAQQPHLSLEELIQVSQSFYQHISSSSEGQQLATRLLLSL